MNKYYFSIQSNHNYDNSYLHLLGLVHISSGYAINQMFLDITEKRLVTCIFYTWLSLIVNITTSLEYVHQQNTAYRNLSESEGCGK